MAFTTVLPGTNGNRNQIRFRSIPSSRHERPEQLNQVEYPTDLAAAIVLFLARHGCCCLVVSCRLVEQ